MLAARTRDDNFLREGGGLGRSVLCQHLSPTFHGEIRCFRAGIDFVLIIGDS